MRAHQYDGVAVVTVLLSEFLKTAGLPEISLRAPREQDSGITGENKMISVDFFPDRPTKCHQIVLFVYAILHSVYA